MQKVIYICDKCGKEIETTRLRISHYATGDFEVECTMCGAKIHSDRFDSAMLFCPYCGRKFDMSAYTKMED